MALNQILTESLWSTHLHHEVSHRVQSVHTDFTVSSEHIQPTEEPFKLVLVLASFLSSKPPGSVMRINESLFFFLPLVSCCLWIWTVSERGGIVGQVCLFLLWYFHVLIETSDKWHQAIAWRWAFKNLLVERKKPQGGISYRQSALVGEMALAELFFSFASLVW